MKVWNVTEGDVRAAAIAVGVAIHSDWAGRNGIVKDGRALNFRLALDTTGERLQEGKTFAGKPHPWPYQRASVHPWEYDKGYQRRRVAAVCWHGHYAFMRYLLAIRPDARIKSHTADYRGLASFLNEAPETAYVNIGSIAYPCNFCDACYCEEYGRHDIRAIDTAAIAWAVPTRLDYLRGEIEAERISYGEIAELQSLADSIPADDVLLRQWAGIPESEV